MFFLFSLSFPGFAAEPTAWFTQLAEAEADFARLSAAWARAADDGAAPAGERSALVDLQHLRATLLVSEHQEAEIAQALLPLRDREGGAIARAEAHAVARSALERRLKDASAARAEKLAVLHALVRGAPGARDALARWEKSWNVSNFETTNGLAGLGGSEDRLLTACAAVNGPTGVAAEELRAEAVGELSIRLELGRQAREDGPLANARREAEAAVADLEAEARAAATRTEPLRRAVAAAELGLATARAKAHPAAADAALLADMRATSALYAQLLVGFDSVPVPVPAAASCQVLVHGGMTRHLLAQDGASELLRTAVAARGGVCRGIAAPLLADPRLQAAWSEALYSESGERPARVVLDAGQVWTIDGVPVTGVGSSTLDVHPGQHRFEHTSADGVFAWLVEDVAPDETLAVWAVAVRGAGARIHVEPLTPAVTDWTVTAPRDRQEEAGATVFGRPRVVGPGEPFLSIGGAVGGGLVHERTFGALALGVLLDPGGTTHLAVDASLLMAQTAQPVFVSRWETDDRLVRVALAGRWTPRPDWRVRPFGRLGAFVEPDVAIGPWVGAGATLRAGPLALDLGVSTPLYFPSRLGHVGLEVLLETRWLAPLSAAE